LCGLVVDGTGARPYFSIEIFTKDENQSVLANMPHSEYAMLKTVAVLQIAVQREYASATKIKQLIIN
jgi:hypothetical protein